MTHELHDLLETARVAARTASQVLAGARAETIRTKRNLRDLVTEWDLRSEATIREVLEQRAPGIAILGEEGGQSGHHDGMRWLVEIGRAHV